MSPQRPDNYIPNQPVQDRKTRFRALNAYVTERGGWIVSLPGAADVTMECLPDSTLPDDVRGLGYDVRLAGQGERIVPDVGIARTLRFNFILQ